MTQSRRQHHQNITVLHFTGNLRQPNQAIHLIGKDKIRLCHQSLKGLGQNLGLGEGKVGSFPETCYDPSITRPYLQWNLHFLQR